METPADLSPERREQLDNLAGLGALLGIHDAATLLDIESVIRTPLPIPCVPPGTGETSDTRLLAAGVPQSAIDRLSPEVDGPLVWDDARLQFIPASPVALALPEVAPRTCATCREHRSISANDCDADGQADTHIRCLCAPNYRAPKGWVCEFFEPNGMQSVPAAPVDP